MSGPSGDLPAAPGRRGWPWQTPDPAPTYDPHTRWPRITLVTPSFNQADFLEITLRSVLLQGYPNLQYLVFDGGSTDGSRQILESYGPHLDFWRSERDGGQSAAINQGLAMGDGEIVNWLNSDDYLLPGALFAVARAHLETAGPRAVYAGSAIRVDSAGHLLHRSPIRRLDAGRSPFTTPVIGGVQASWFWTRELWRQLGGLDVELDYAMDVDLHLRLGTIPCQLVPIEDELAAFRIHDSAKTSRHALPAVLEREALYRRLLRAGTYPDDAHHRGWLRRDISSLSLHWAPRAPDLATTVRLLLHAARLYPRRLAQGDFWRYAWTALRARGRSV